MRNPENRRLRLKEWFANRSIPAEEKSYISQLMTGKASFGEKAAIRLEELLGMDDGYLDWPVGAISQFNCSKEAVEIIRMMELMDERGRVKILSAAQDAFDRHTAHMRETHQESIDQVGRMAERSSVLKSLEIMSDQQALGDLRSRKL